MPVLYRTGAFCALLLCLFFTAAALAVDNSSHHNVHDVAMAAAGPTPCPHGWEIVPAPNEGTSHPHGVAAAGPNDIWGVGYVIVPGGEDNTFIHWDGSTWSNVPGPDPDTYSKLNAVSAAASNDVWAAGSYGPSSSIGSTMLLHWDGTQWTQATSPNPGSQHTLFGVVVAGPGDVWAVGRYFSGGIYQTLTLRLVGDVWTHVASPNVGGASVNSLQGVSATGPGDVWAVGYSSTGGVNSTLTMHWDGAAWSIVPSPHAGLSIRFLGVTTLAASDAWAVGSMNTDSGLETVTMHWDGTAWSIVPSPNIGINTELWGTNGWTSNDVWAVGIADDGGFNYRPVALHWDGISWQDTGALYDPGAPVAYHLHSVVAIGSNEAWIGGELGVTVVEHYAPLCPATATATAMPASPTSTSASTVTSVPATSTPTATNTSMSTATTSATTEPTAPPTSTPTICTLQFTDVPAGSTFHPFVQCLACRGFMSGYRCGSAGEPCDGDSNPYFRPNMDVTRGQLSKIVANAAGLADPPGEQLFEDVPPGTTFYDFVQRLASLGHVGGYACGGASEPCGGGNLPYFRPGNSATRGQIAKIVSNTYGYNDPAGDQAFEDVPPGSTYFDFIQRLASRGHIGGYACGSAGEPCGGGDLPYFRPGSNATRGQVSKIVASASSPVCVAR